MLQALVQPPRSFPLLKRGPTQQHLHSPLNNTRLRFKEKVEVLGIVSKAVLLSSSNIPTD